MKKIIVLVVLLFLTMGISAKNPIGKWKNGNVVFTFQNDTLLYIDEIGNEGEAYNYQIKGDKLILKRICPYNDVDTLTIYKTDNKTLYIGKKNKLYRYCKIM
jgi:hypothetical protein